MNLTQTLHSALQRSPDRAMTICGERTRSVAESADRIARLAGALRSMGVRDGDRIGIYALNSDRYHELLLAVPWAGAAVNPVNIRWSAAEVAYSLVDCGADVLFVDDAFAGTIDALREKVPNLATVVFCGDGPTPAGMVDYEQLVADHDPVEDARRGGDDLFGVFYTGGTTGNPKGVMLSHRNLLSSATGSLVTADILTRGGHLLHAAPMFHLADIAAWSMGLLTGSTHVIVPMFTADGVVDAISRHQVTDTLLVPTMIQMLIDSPLAEGADLSSLQRVVYGASPMPQDVLDRARKTFTSARFTQAYGMTELSPIATLLTAEDHDDPSLTRSCGRPTSCSELRIVDADDNEVPRGVVGEVVVRGDHVMLGYWNQEKTTRNALRNGWMHTGDGAYMDERGYVFVVDRIKDMIVTGGENVYSAEVENALTRHPAVASCAVIGVPDREWGERVHAVIVLRSGERATLEELRDFGREHIAGYKLPRSVAFVDALPLSGAGKILKRELREEHWAGAERAVN
ncbi:long-chain-fatty-acid--CoA ligase [Nocardioides sp. NPDC101246]|uniref:long-chain-fatty-acid--CoA ligase n=1 Tax=Nocardioides sp. NPDC101246 TaxID=3364336 RepID=UPI003830D512